MISGHQGLLTSRDQDAKTSIRTDFLASLSHDGLSSRFIHPISKQFCSRCRLRERVVRLFRLAGEQAGTGRNIRPVFGGQKHYMFCPRQAVFSVTRNRFRNRKQLARKGVELLRSRRFYRGHRGPTRNLAGERFSRPLHQKTGKIRPFWRGKVAVYRPNQTSRQPVFGRFSAVEVQNCGQISRIWTCF